MIEVGQVLSLRIRFNNSGDVSRTRHPYLVVDVNDNLRTIEIAQLDSLEGKEYKATMRSNKTILCDKPRETVIDKDSYVQLDNTIQVESFPELASFRRQEDKLSSKRLEAVLLAYRRYHDSWEIDENKSVYMNKAEILDLNG